MCLVQTFQRSSCRACDHDRVGDVTPHTLRGPCIICDEHVKKVCWQQGGHPVGHVEVGQCTLLLLVVVIHAENA